ncbi:MAG: PadR family transcriptional regulator [Candidatus Bathyarchaeota archaeon]|nr:PadR family transcriptional regulator [Candidatus Bathyarchaeota archaeon]
MSCPEEKETANWINEAQKGYIRIGVLILLNKKPAHGYEIMKEIKDRTKGFWKPTPGGVYPVLRNLEKSGYIKGRWETQKNRNLKVYTITPHGEAILKRAIIKQSEIFTNIGNLFREFARDVLNIKPPNDVAPPMPSLFSPFFEEKTSPETLESLEAQRQQIKEKMSMLRERLGEVNQEIDRRKKQTP